MSYPVGWKILVIGLSLSSMACAKFGESTPQAPARPANPPGAGLYAPQGSGMVPATPTTATPTTALSTNAISGSSPQPTTAAAVAVPIPPAQATGPALMIRSASPAAPVTAAEAPCPPAPALTAPTAAAVAPTTAAPKETVYPTIAQDQVAVALPAAATLRRPPVRARPVCPAPYRNTDPAWAPGLPRPPMAKPMFIDRLDHLKEDGGYQYTDAMMDSKTSIHDSLLNMIVRRANPLPAASRAVARRIENVLVAVDPHPNGAVKVKIMYADPKVNKGVATAFILSGHLDLHPAANRADVELTQKKTATGQYFSGVLTCADLPGCQNAVIRLDLHHDKGPADSVFLLHRWSLVELTASDRDLRNLGSSHNEGYVNFGELLFNTLNNFCIEKIAELEKRHVPPANCEMQHLQQECGGDSNAAPAGKAAGIRTWVVAYGRSGFHLSLMTEKEFNGVADFDTHEKVRFSVQGNLLYLDKPSWQVPVSVIGPKALETTGELLNNDGGGQLNFRLKFKGDSAKNISPAEVRISATALLPTDESIKSIVESAQQMPELSNDKK